MEVANTMELNHIDLVMVVIFIDLYIEVVNNQAFVVESLDLVVESLDLVVNNLE